MCCYGVIFHNTAEKDVDNVLGKKGFPIEEVKIKLKGGISNHYYIAWHKMNKKLSEGDISKVALEWLKELRKTMSGNPRVYLDNTKNIIENNQSVKTDMTARTLK